MGSAEVGLKRDDTDARALLEEAAGNGWVGIFKRELPPLGCAPFDSGPGHLGVKDVCAIGRQVSDCIGSGVEVHLLAPIYTSYPNWTHKKG